MYIYPLLHQQSQSTKNLKILHPMAYLSDIEIAQANTLQHISTIAKKLQISDDDLEMYGKYKAKLPLHLIDEEKIQNNNLGN